jgi:iron complex outermembrane receptor protein
VVQASITLPKDFDLNVAYRYVSEIPNQLVDAYSTGDVRIGRKLGNHFELEVVGRNLLQPFHPEYGGTPGPLVGIRRSGFVALTWTP